MNEQMRRARIRELHRTGEVPCDDTPIQLWAGRGVGNVCAVCTERIDRDETEFEVELASGRILRLHRPCHALWVEECGEEVGAG